MEIAGSPIRNDDSAPFIQAKIPGDKETNHHSFPAPPERLRHPTFIGALSCLSCAMTWFKSREQHSRIHELYRSCGTFVLYVICIKCGVRIEMQA